DIEAQIAYSEQQRFDGFARAIANGAARKQLFDKVEGRSPGEVIFAVGELVQVLDPKYKKTFRTSRKILPEWSGAFRVRER
ncbi:hypothetical protein B0H10DRAFT_1712665, partial [Mycena sp. CBHHK59/15]